MKPSRLDKIEEAILEIALHVDNYPPPLECGSIYQKVGNLLLPDSLDQSEKEEKCYVNFKRIGQEVVEIGEEHYISKQKIIDFLNSQ